MPVYDKRLGKIDRVHVRLIREELALVRKPRPTLLLRSIRDDLYILNESVKLIAHGAKPVIPETVNGETDILVTRGGRSEIPKAYWNI